MSIRMRTYARLICLSQRNGPSSGRTRMGCGQLGPWTLGTRHRRLHALLCLPVVRSLVVHMRGRGSGVPGEELMPHEW
jgi:hypothetical protein